MSLHTKVMQERSPRQILLWRVASLRWLWYWIPLLARRLLKRRLTIDWSRLRLRLGGWTLQRWA